ncbi:unnamed protein product [Amaranthus hypochondriacus]
MTSQGTSHHKHALYEFDCKSQYKCDGCEMDGFGKRFRCKKCNYDLHPECNYAEAIIEFEGQKYEFFAKPPKGVNCSKRHKSGCRCCDACGITLKGYTYHCTDTDFDFHPKCVKLDRKIVIEDVIFTLQDQMPQFSNCASCEKKHLEGAVEKIPGWSYISEYGECNFHVYCMMKMLNRYNNSSASSSSSSSSFKNVSAAGDHSVMLQKSVQPGPDKVMKSKKQIISSKSSRCWFDIIKIFLSTVFSIVLGDPTTIVATTVAHLVTQAAFNLG